MSTEINSLGDAITHFTRYGPQKLADLKNGKLVSFEWEKSLGRINCMFKWAIFAGSFMTTIGSGLIVRAVVLNRYRLLISVPLVLGAVSLLVIALNLFKAAKLYSKFNTLIKQFLEAAKTPQQATFDMKPVTLLKDEISFEFEELLSTPLYSWAKIGIHPYSYYHYPALFHFTHIYKTDDQKNLWEKMSVASKRTLFRFLVSEDSQKQAVNALAIAIGKAGSQLTDECLQKLDDKVKILAVCYKSATFNDDGSGLSILPDEKEYTLNALLPLGKALLEAK